MPIYLKKNADGVEAYGDEESLKKAGVDPDLVVTEAQWERANCGAHVEDGAIVLGHGAGRLAEIVREERNWKLADGPDRITAVRWATMSTELREKWKAYRQALLDVPQTDGFPWDGVNVPWPTKPE